MVHGEAGSDTLSGDGGNDKLWGGLGRDFLNGGGGADQFIFTEIDSSNPRNPDDIADFSTADDDRIDFGAIDADTRRFGNQAFHLVAGEFSGVAGELRAEGQGLDLVIYADNNGDGQADFALLLRGVTTLTDVTFVL